jgi:adenylate cyclase
MESLHVERKLTTILHADVAGYSRLMGADEVGTLRMLTTCRQTTDPLIQQHRGRVVGSAGDSILAEFVSVVEAVQCAVEIQQALRSKNNKLPPGQQMEFRIGINLGDVIVEGEQIYGDGVNIAARLESLADPGGVCISGTVYDQVKNKLAFTYDDLGEQRVKNIAEPVRVYRIVIKVPSPLVGERQGEGAAREAGSAKFKVQSAKKSRVRPAHRWMVAGLLLVMGTIITVRYLPFPFPNPQSPTPNTQPPLGTQHSVLGTEAALPLPDKPSIVVLPFVNMSNDPEQEYFSDGITEDITSDLSKISSLFVIARNSAFTYKGKAVKVQDVSREMGVRYVLEGSVRKIGDQVRITTQLIDATTGGHLWSERYDRPLKDIFAVQDEIVQQIVANLRVEMLEAEFARVRRVPTENLTSYDFYLRGLQVGVRALTEASKEANEQARQMYEKAVELDPTYAEAYAMLGFTYYNEFFNRWTADPAQALERAFTLAQQAVTLDDSLPTPHLVLGYAFLWKKQHDQAIIEVKTAMALDPNNPNTHASLGIFLAFAGQPQEGVEFVEKALRLNPRYPANYLQNLGRAYRLAGRCEEAISPLKRAIALSPTFIPSRVNLVVCYMELGREEEARAEATEVLRINPNYSLEEAWKHNQPFKDPAVLEHFFAAARKAGLK